MQRQAVSQQSLVGFDADELDAAFHTTSSRYQAAHYVEEASSSVETGGRAVLESHSLQEVAVRVLLDLIRAGHSLACAASWGKDSFTCVVLLIEAVRRAAAEGIFTIHYINTSSTGIENPAMENHALRCQDEVRAYCDKNGLPIEVHTVYPSLASSFVGSTIGRGTLPRTAENGKVRQCSVDWKVLPGQRLTGELNDRVLTSNGRELVTIIGTRLDESAVRAERMKVRGESATTPVRNPDGRLVLSVIAYWTLDDVWNTIEMVMDPASSPYKPALSSESVERLFTLYRDANDGVCGVTLGDGGNRKSCGSRFGCAFCCVSGEKDKSMESMLADPGYAYMQPLNDFRNLLLAAQWDFEKRELIGRTVSPAGYIQIRPNVYTLAFRQELLWYLLSMDADERERAEKLEADIFTGRVADTPDNRALASPMFENVSVAQLAIVDFHWGMNADAEHAFPALSIWYEVNVLGRRRRVPKQTKAPKINVPSKRWFPVGRFDHDAIPSEGLRSHVDELWNKHRHPDRPMTYRVVDGERTVWFDEDDNLTVDAAEACSFITCTYPDMVIETRGMTGIESSRFWLNEGFIKLPQGHAARYQEIAKRGQYFAALGAKLNLAPSELAGYLLNHSITNAEHEKLLPPPSQQDLFSQPLAA